MDEEDAVEVVLGRGRGRSSSFTFLPRAAFHAAEPVLSNRSLKFLRASSRPHKLRGILQTQRELACSERRRNKTLVKMRNSRRNCPRSADPLSCRLLKA